MLWPTDYNPFTFLSRNHQHFVLTGYIALIACHRRFSILHRRRQSNTASSALFRINADLLHLFAQQTQGRRPWHADPGKRYLAMKLGQQGRFE